ncbi:MAG: glycosyltransferase [Acidimicrobiales bacterium]
MTATTGVAPGALRSVASDLPAPPFQHLLRLSDDTGVFEHARGPMPRRSHGYCVDDVARALLVISREPYPSPEVARLGERCLAFLAHAQSPDGRFANRLGFDRRFEDEPSDGDWWGRALWGLGTAAAGNPTPWVRDQALISFELGCDVRSPFRRAMAFAGLGAAAVLAAAPGHEGATRLLRAAAQAVGRPGADASWPWPEPRLTYGNASLPDVLLAAGSALEDPTLVHDGVVLLDWFRSIEAPGGRLSLTPVGGWGPGEARPAYDQQPIEAAALADAAARAHDVTGEARWLDVVRGCADWFLGANDVGLPLYDPDTGGGYDGLEAGGHNANQGAESTLAFLSTMQQARRLLSPAR